MKIQSLKVFCDLAETKSFTRAAQLNKVTQSAVSQNISALERHFKVLLIKRSKSKSVCTREGEALYDYSQDMLEIYDELVKKLKDTKEKVSGNLRVAAIYSIGLYDLATCLQRFIKDYPAANVHVEYRRANQVYEDIEGNTVDLGLVAYPIRDRSLEFVPLGKDPLVLICHPQHPFAKLKTIKLKSLNGQKLISFDRDTPTGKALNRLLRTHHVAVTPGMEFDNIDTVKQAVEIDAGVAIVPETTVRQEIATQTLAALRLEDGDFARPLAAVYRRGKVLSPAMKQFVAILKESI